MKKNASGLLDDLFRAYFDTRRHKRNTHSQLAFEFDYEHNLIELCRQIDSRNYRPAPAICFIAEEPVKREIFASSFSHRVVCRLLYNYIAPLFDARMIYDSYSCRVGKGVFVGIERLEHHLRSCTRNHTCRAYVLKLDLRGYFMNIDKRILHGVLLQGLDRHWNKPSGDGRLWSERLDRELIDYLIEVILYRNPVTDCIMLGRASDWKGLPASKSLFHAPENVGLAIGDITSQLFSNILMDRFDQFVKRELECRYYGRYVDDFYIVHSSRRYLERVLVRVKSFLETELHLALHPDKIILRSCRYGIPFLGAYVKPYRRYPTKDSVSRFRRRVRMLEAECRCCAPSYGRLLQIRAVLNSYCGHFRHFRAYRILHAQFADSPLRRYFDFTTDFRKAVLKKEFKPRWRMPFEQGATEGMPAGAAMVDGR